MRKFNFAQYIVGTLVGVAGLLTLKIGFDILQDSVR